MTITVPRWAFCVECGHHQRVNQTGLFRKHFGRWPIEVPDRPVCPGSGKKASA